MGIVIRVLYNNKQWRGRCEEPGIDPLCWKCREARRDLDRGKPRKLNITPPEVGEKECSGYCWEWDFCNSYDWGSDQHFNKVWPGMKVYLVFEQKNDMLNRVEYRLFGRTTVKNVNMPPARKLERDNEKYKYWIHLEPFEPLPSEKWSKALCAKDLVGSKWGQGFYRYIEEDRETFLDKLLLGVSFEEAANELTVTQPAGKTTKSELLASNIEQEIQEIAKKQGRTREEIIRQAVAEWIQKQE